MRSTFSRTRRGSLDVGKGRSHSGPTFLRVTLLVIVLATAVSMLGCSSSKNLGEAISFDPSAGSTSSTPTTT